MGRTFGTTEKRFQNQPNTHRWGMRGTGAEPRLARVERTRPLVDTRTTMERLKKQFPEVWKHKSIKFAEGGRLAEEAAFRKANRGSADRPAGA